MKRLPLLILGGCLLLAATAAAPSRAQTAVQQQLEPCTVKGRIYDDESGETMPYTNVFISGTNIGTMAFTDGFYIMKGLRPGTYTIKASYISYGVGSQTITLAPGEVRNLDFRLEVQAIMADPYEVSAERALIEVDRTGSSHYITSQQLDAMPLDSVVDMIAQQPGVTLQDNAIHIRGGRADDTMFVVDGMAVNDPLAGGGYGYSIDPSLINEIEIMTGGFNAEYGQAVSGVVNVSTKEGNDYVEGRVSFKRDYLWQTVPKDDPRDYRDFDNVAEGQNIDQIKGSLSGPDPLSAALRKLGVNMPGKQYLLVSASADLSDGYLPIYSRQNKLASPLYGDDFWAPRADNNWNGMAKWTWNVTPDHKVNVTTSRQVGINQGFRLAGEGFPRPFIDNLDNALVYTNENILTQVQYRQVLSEKSWFEFQLGRNFARQHINVNGNDDYWTYEEIDFPQQDPANRAVGSADRWHDHYVESYTMKGSYSFMGSQENEFKTGFELSFTEMQLIDLQNNLANPPSGKLGIGQDIFQAHPITGSAFFQDTIKYRGLVVNAGLRTDFWAPGREVEHVMANHEDYLFIFPEMVQEFEDGTTDVFGRAWKMRLSPRLGLSFPVTERDKFFFNYGHFSQWPRFAYVYPQLETQVASKIQLLGNPNLDPKVTVEYETGIQHEFGGLWSLGVTFFNRDIYDYAKSVKLDGVEIGADETPDPNDSDSITVDPVRYFNGDSARSLGVEFSVIKRTTRWLSGSANLELQRSTGTNSDADQGYLAAVFGESDATVGVGGLRREPLLWDKPWSASMNIDFSVFDNERPELFGWRMPPNWSLNLLARAEAGQRYTPLTWVGPNLDPERGDRYSAIGPYKSSINIRFSKFWKFGKREKLTFTLEVRNLLNHANYRRVNPYTGEGYKVGDYNPSWEYDAQQNPPPGIEPEELTTDSEYYAKGVVDPSYREDPFTFLWGVSYSW